uniref:Uncharacterized protein n=1 Tax=Arundo donax TaxID=35708 RepID=A0A0A9BIV6_ARUDO
MAAARLEGAYSGRPRAVDATSSKG